MAGLTLNAKLYNSVGTQVGATATSGFIDHGDRSYSYLATIPQGHVGSLVVYDSANPTTRAVRFSINPQETEISRLAWENSERTLTAFGANTLTEFTYTVTSDATAQPLSNVYVRITTDSAGVNTVWAGTTDAFGVARDAFGQKPRLSAGTYYFWRTLSGYSFSDPDTETVS